jgi:hypothetical protein
MKIWVQLNRLWLGFTDGLFSPPSCSIKDREFLGATLSFSRLISRYQKYGSKTCMWGK